MKINLDKLLSLVKLLERIECDECLNEEQSIILEVYDELGAARKIISLAQSLFSEEDAFNAVSHFNVAFGLRDALKEYEDVVKG